MGSVCLVAAYGLVAKARGAAGAPGAPDPLAPQGLGPWLLLGALTLGALIALLLRAKPALARLRRALAARSRRVPWTAGLFLVGLGVFLLGELTGAAQPRVTPLEPQGAPLSLARSRTVGGPEGELAGGPALARLELEEGQVWVTALEPGVLLEGQPLAPGARRAAPGGSVLVAGPRRLRLDVPPLTRVLGGGVLGRLAGLLALVVGLTVFAPSLLAPLGLRRPTGRELLRGGAAWLGTLPLYAGAVLLGAAASNALGVPSQSHELVRLIEREGLAALGLVFALAAVLAPLKEELLLRGILLPALGNAWGPLGAWLASSLLFALIHLSLAALLPMLVLGLLFGALRLTAPDDDPLTAAVTAHVLHNGTTLLLVALGMLAR